MKRVTSKAGAAGLTSRQLEPSTFEPARLPELFLQLHLERFGERSAFRGGSTNRRFAELALPQLFQAGRLAVFVLEQEGRPIAIDLSIVGDGSLCTWNGGYPPRAEPWSPGKLLIWTGIRRACDLGFCEYDLLRGEQQWKTHFISTGRNTPSFPRSAGKLRCWQ